MNHDHPSFRRKAEQLRVAIRRALTVALDCDVDDPLLDGLYMHDVVSAPGGSFAALFATDHVDQIDAMQERLREAAPVLRTALADALMRKRVPIVAFYVIPADRAEQSEVEHPPDR